MIKLNLVKWFFLRELRFYELYYGLMFLDKYNIVFYIYMYFSICLYIYLEREVEREL